MARRRRRAGMHLNAEINVVSLIDVMLLLLVIFMLTAPMMTGGVDLKLPDAAAKPLETKSGLVVKIDRDGNVWVNDDKMSFSEFSSTFPTYAKGKARDGVDLYADQSLPYGRVAQVMAVIRAAGVTALGLATDPQQSVVK